MQALLRGLSFDNMVLVSACVMAALRLLSAQKWLKQAVLGLSIFRRRIVQHLGFCNHHEHVTDEHQVK